MRRLILSVMVAAILSAGAIGAYGDDFQPDGSGGSVSDTADFLLPEDVASTTMTDVLTQSVLGPCETIDGQCQSSTPRTCTYFPLDDRTSGPVPADATQWQVIYLVPSDGIVQPWSRPTGCNDGYGKESNIGYGIHNTRAWMASRRTQNDAVRAKSFKVLTRSYSAYGRTWTRYHVMFVRGPRTTAQYRAGSAQDTFNRVIADLNNLGFSRPTVKYVVFADVITNGGGPAGTTCTAGQAEYNGNQGVEFRRCQRATPNSAPTGLRWGCADTGDTVAMHEAVHEWGIVDPASAEYDIVDGNRHVTQQGDLMFRQALSTLSGFNDVEGPAASGQTIWDDGLGSYTARVLAFPSYLTLFANNSPLHRCTENA